jgi:hypothetical protein
VTGRSDRRLTGAVGRGRRDSRAACARGTAGKYVYANRLTPKMNQTFLIRQVLTLIGPDGERP